MTDQAEKLTEKQERFLLLKSKHYHVFDGSGPLDLPVEFVKNLTKSQASILIGTIKDYEDGLGPEDDLDEWPMNKAEVFAALVRRSYDD